MILDKQSVSSNPPVFFLLLFLAFFCGNFKSPCLFKKKRFLLYWCTYECCCCTVVHTSVTSPSCCFFDHVSSNKNIKCFGYSCVSFVSLFINLRHPRDFTSHTSRKGTMYNEEKSCFFRPAGRFCDGLAGSISTTLGSDDGNRPGTASHEPRPRPRRGGPHSALSKLRNSSQFPGTPLRTHVPSRLRETSSVIETSSEKESSVNPIQFSYEK